jgi:hypothetical protein
MAKLIQRGSGRSFRVEIEEVDVTTGPLPEPDPEWTYTDHKGHAHALVNGEYPSLRWVDDEPYWCEQHQEEHETGHYECARCGEEIEPGARLRGGGYRKFAPGLKSYFIDDEPVDEATYERELRANGLA